MESDCVNRSVGFGRCGLVITESSTRSGRKESRSGRFGTERMCTLKQNVGGYPHDFSTENTALTRFCSIRSPQMRHSPHKSSCFLSYIHSRRYVVMKRIFPVVSILQMTAIGRPEAFTIMS